MRRTSLIDHNKFQEQCNVIINALCKLCPHQNEKHDMNCLACCPIMRAKDKIIEVKNDESKQVI